MTMGFHMVVQHAPPLIGCIIGPWDYSYRALRETGECVIAIPTVDLARKVVDIGNCSGETIDKFAKFKLTPLPASEVEAPLIAECVANIECRVADTALEDKSACSSLKPSGSGPIRRAKNGGRFTTTATEPSSSMAGRSTFKNAW
jgi:hypothetical protein